jgi:hypothetical protein
MGIHGTPHAPPIVRHAAIVAILALGLAACGRVTGSGSGADTTRGGISHPTGANDLLLRVAETGGFIAPRTVLHRYPIISLYGDGAAITQGAQIDIYPQPALPALIATHLTEAGVQRILHAAIAAGLSGPNVTYAGIPVADVPSTVFTFTLDGRTHTITVTALGSVGGGAPGSTGSAGGSVVPEPTGASGSTDAVRRLSREEARARAALTAFVTRLGDLRSWLPTGSVGSDVPFEPTAMRVFVAHGAPRDPGGTLHEPDVVWPLATPLADFGTPIATPMVGGPERCGVVDGGDLAKLLPKARAANQLSPWVSGGRRYALSFRPLLPDEAGC